MINYDSKKIRIEIIINDTAGWDVDLNDEQERNQEIKDLRADVTDSVINMGIDDFNISIDFID